MNGEKSKTMPGVFVVAGRGKVQQAAAPDAENHPPQHAAVYVEKPCGQRGGHSTPLQVVQGTAQWRISELQAQLAAQQRSCRTAQQLAEHLRAELNRKEDEADLARQRRALTGARNEAMRLRAKYEEEKAARQAAEALLRQLLADLDEEARAENSRPTTQLAHRDAIVLSLYSPHKMCRVNFRAQTNDTARCKIKTTDKGERA